MSSQNPRSCDSNLERSSTEELLKSMSTHPSTNGWDVVCSYTLEQLNATLRDRYDSPDGKIVKNVPFSLTYRDRRTKEEIIYDYNMVLGSPSVSFMTGINGMCNLTMQILGGTCTDREQKEVTEIPKGKYSLKACLPLVAVYGNTQVAESGAVVVFGHEKDPAHITLHFTKNAANNWEITPTPDPADQAVLDCLEDIDNYFRKTVSEIDYTLTSITNQSTSTGKFDVVIEPLSFIFVTSGAEKDGILSLYIQTENSGNGQGDRKPSFQPGGATILPIPKDHQASLVFSRSFFQKVYLLKALTDSNFDKIKYDTSTIESIYSCNATGVYKYSAQIPRKEYRNGTETSELWNFSKVDFSADKYTFQFLFSSDNLKVTMPEMVCSFQWSWERSVSSEAPTIGGQGDAEMTITVSNTFKLADIIKVSDTDVTMEFNLTFTISPLKQTRGDGLYDSKHIEDYVFALAKNLITLPEIKLPLSGFNYFKETNLLFPGEKVLSLDSTFGARVPCDLIILGNFEKKQK